MSAIPVRVFKMHPLFWRFETLIPSTTTTPFFFLFLSLFLPRGSVIRASAFVFFLLLRFSFFRLFHLSLPLRISNQPPCCWCRSAQNLLRCRMHRISPGTRIFLCYSPSRKSAGILGSTLSFFFFFLMPLFSFPLDTEGLRLTGTLHLLPRPTTMIIIKGKKKKRRKG